MGRGVFGALRLLTAPSEPPGGAGPNPEFPLHPLVTSCGGRLGNGDQGLEGQSQGPAAHSRHRAPTLRAAQGHRLQAIQGRAVTRALRGPWLWLPLHSHPPSGGPEAHSGQVWGWSGSQMVLPGDSLQCSLGRNSTLGEVQSGSRKPPLLAGTGWVPVGPQGS